MEQSDNNNKKYLPFALNLTVTELQRYASEHNIPSLCLSSDGVGLTGFALHVVNDCIKRRIEPPEFAKTLLLLAEENFKQAVRLFPDDVKTEIIIKIKIASKLTNNGHTPTFIMEDII
jgi:hypothetical protein